MRKNGKPYISTILILLMILISCTCLQGCGVSGAPDQTIPSSEPELQIKETEKPVPEDAAPTEADINEIESPASDDPYPSNAEALHVEGTHLADSSGNPVQLKGISSHNLSQYPEYINQECFSLFRREWNVNVIRLAMYTAEQGGYCADGNKEALKAVIKNGIDYAAREDLYVIVDWHILSDSDPNQHLEEAKAFFDEISGQYADHDNILYEICNEPNGGTPWQEIKKYALEVIPIIRNNDPNAVILVGTPSWCQDVEQAALDPITEYDNIMYSLHFYAASHKEELRSKMTAAIEAGLPVFVSEYGICDANGSGNIDEEQARIWINTLDQYGISYVAWNLSNKAETSAILKNSCGKISGFTQEDLSPSGQWLYQMLTEKNFSACTPETIEFIVDAVLVNSWQEDGTTIYQYTLTLTNPSDSASSHWDIDIRFKEDITLREGWNGDYSVEGNILHITSKDYNGIIPEEGSLSDIGFIVAGGGGIS